MEKTLQEKTKESINHILDEGLNTSNLETLYKLIDIYKDAKEVENMNYGNYNGRMPGYDSYGRGNYGEYGNYGANYGAYYGARGRDRRYRGEEELDRMSGEYGRYQEGRQRYGASEETDKSFHYMLQALEDFIKVLHEEADTPQQKQKLNETLQRSMR